MADENIVKKEGDEVVEAEAQDVVAPEAAETSPGLEIRLVADNTEQQVEKTMTNADLKQSQAEILELQRSLSEKRNKLEEIRLMLKLKDVETIGSLEELERNINTPTQTGEEAWKRRFYYLLISYQEDIDRTAMQLQRRVEEREKIKSVIKASQRDTLLDCYSKRYIEEYAKKTFEASKEGKKPVSVLFVDLDYFKRINDTFGHKVGDRVLKSITTMLQSEVRERDYVGRYGGEEFMLILPNATIEEAARVGERIRKRAESMSIRARTLKGMEAEIPITASVGVSQADFENDQDYEEMIKRADSAALRAKEEQRNLVIRNEYDIAGQPIFSTVTTDERKIPEPYSRR